MPSVWISTKVNDFLLKELEKLYPSFAFFTQTAEPLTEKQEREVEVYFGPTLSKETLNRLSELRWFHSTSPTLSTLAWEELKQRENLIVTLSHEENIPRKAEFVQAALLAFFKNLYQWKEASSAPNHPEQHEEMWRKIETISGKIHLQIGLGPLGSAIAERSQRMGMHVWGVRELPSFHPYCEKTYHRGDLHSLLPSADVVVLSTDRWGEVPTFFNASEFKLIKKGAIVALLIPWNGIDPNVLADYAEKKELRILWDASGAPPFGKGSPLWKISYLLLTPGITASSETGSEKQALLFAKNFRYYTENSWEEMQNRVHPRILAPRTEHPST